MRRKLFGRSSIVLRDEDGAPVRDHGLFTRYPPAVASMLAETRVSGADAMARSLAILDTVNDQVRQAGGTGVRALPLCGSAVVDNELTEFLFDLGLDPFLPWNTLYLADDDSTATLLDTLVFDERLGTRHDGEIKAEIVAARTRWQSVVNEVEVSGDTSGLSSVLEDIRAGLRQVAADFQRQIFDGKRNDVRALILDQPT